MVTMSVMAASLLSRWCVVTALLSSCIATPLHLGAREGKHGAAHVVVGATKLNSGLNDDGTVNGTPTSAAQPHRRHSAAGHAVVPAASAVVVYGATPGGCAAAISAARMLNTTRERAAPAGRVVLIEPGPRVGGMAAGGLGNTDLGDGGRELGGIAREFYERVAEYYATRTLRAPPAARCTLVEAHVAEAVYTNMLTEAGVTVLVGYRVTAVQRDPADATRLASATVCGRDGSTTNIKATVMVDATYEGDLMAMGGVAYTIGRESRTKYNEPSAGVLAPNNVLERYQFQVPVDPFNHTTGDLLPLVQPHVSLPLGSADAKVEAYCYRICMSRLDGGRAVPVPLPKTYDSAQWELFRRLLAASPSATNASDFLYFAGPLGNSSGASSKYDVGENGAISLDYVGESWLYPNATLSQRKDIVDSHVEYTLGFLHFLSTDPAVPPVLRNDVARWGLCADEFADESPAHFPRSALYVREARRMVGTVVVTEHDRVTNRTKPDSVGLGSYNCDCHMVERIVAPPINISRSEASAATWVLNEGWLPKDFARTFWELPLSMMLPKSSEASNLVVPISVSASHVAFNGVRLEPTWMVLGHAAGAVAAMAVEEGVPVQGVNVAHLQALLVAQGQILHEKDVPEAVPVEWCGR